MTSATRRKIRENLEAWGYITPALIFIVTFWFLPVLVSFAMSFGNVTALRPLDQMEFVGLRQYSRALHSEDFIQSFWNTANYVIFSVPLTLSVALCAALLLNRKIAGRGFFRTIYFLPYITTWVAISLVFRYLFHREFGLGNWLLGSISHDLLGLKETWRLEWLGEPRGILEMALWQPIFGHGVRSLPLGLEHIANGPSLSLFTILLTSVWRDVGYYMIIFLAGLQNIDKNLYEAAAIDGADGANQFRYITFPLLSPVTFFLTVISMIGAFKVFVPQFMMTPTGGPDNSTMPIVMYVYREGFTGEWKLSYAAAVAYLLTMIILFLTFVQNRLIGRRVEYGQ